MCTEYFTSDTYRPTKKLASTSETGSATIIIGGLSLGMLSTALPIIIISACVLVAFFCAGGVDAATNGLFGVAVAAVGMLSTLGITLATDAYGPVADNAGGIAEMAGLDHEVSKAHRRPRLAGQHHRRHRKGLCHRRGGADRAGPDRLLRGKDPGRSTASELSDLNYADYEPDRPYRHSLSAPACPFVFAALTMESVGQRGPEHCQGSTPSVSPRSRA